MSEENQSVRSQHEEIGIRLKPDHKPDDAPEEVHVSFASLDYELFQQRIEEYGFSNKSQAFRYFLNIGMRSVVENDPQNSRSNQTTDQSNTTTIEEYVPEGKENALNIRDGEVIDAIENNILEIVDDNPNLNRDGFEVYR